jgi:DNA-binding transcriptional LysR family regulator
VPYLIVDVSIKQLRYFVAVAEELHFGRAAERLHMSQSPLSRSIRDLERELGLVLFVRTTRRVELTPAGAVFLKRSRHALAEMDGAIAEARRTGQPESGSAVRLGFNHVSRTLATKIEASAKAERADLDSQLDEDASPELLRRLTEGELTAAIVLQTPAACRRHGVRIDSLKDEPLLAALPASHAYARADAMPIGAFAAERVLLPRGQPAKSYAPWLRSLIRAAGFELDDVLESANAQWDRRMLPVVAGEAVGVVVADWTEDWSSDLVAVPFDPPLAMPLDLASCWPSSPNSELLVRAACRVRDAEGWLTQRSARIELPSD